MGTCAMPPPKFWKGEVTACQGWTKRATKLACISVTASSIDTPEPSLRISTPVIFMAQAAPCSLVPARVMSKGRIWSEYQGRSFLLEAGDGRDRSAAELVDGCARGDAVGTYQRGLIDRVLGQESVLIGHELGTEIVDIGDELAAQFVDQIQQGMAIEVDPDQAAGDAALVAGEGTDVRGTHGVDRGLFAGNAVRDGLDLRKLVPDWANFGSE